MAIRIDTVSARDKLGPRREPYWHRLRRGCYVGFRKVGATAGGAWVARARGDGMTASQCFKPLGDFSDRADHLRFDAASKAALAWFEHIDRGGATTTTTLAEACNRYVRHLTSAKGRRAADDAEARLKRHVLSSPKLSAIDLPKLTPAHLDAWRQALKARPTGGYGRGRPRSDSALNRDMTCLRAALNLAYLDGLVTSDFAWRSKLRPVRNADQRRDLYLDRKQRVAFIENAPTDLAAFLRALCQLPLRPGALAALTVADFDQKLSVLKVGRDKSGMDRRIKLPEVTAAHFGAAAAGKEPGAALFTRADGKAWDKDAWKWPVKAAAEAAKLPTTTTTYTLRHSVISDLVHDGLDLLTVAQISGTSVAMIEKHYGHLRSEVAVGALARLAL